MKELRLILKVDVQGSLEAIAQTLQKLTNDDVKVSILHRGTGGITDGRSPGGGIERYHRRVQRTA